MIYALYIVESMDRILQYITEYTHRLSFVDLPEEVVNRAKYLVIDTVGCALGGAQSPPAIIATAAAAELITANPATVLVSGEKTAPDLGVPWEGSSLPLPPQGPMKGGSYTIL